MAWISQVDIKRSPTCKLTCFQGQHEIKRQPTQIVYASRQWRLTYRQGGGKCQLYLFAAYIALEMSPISELFQYRLDEITDGVQCGKPFFFFFN